MFHLREQHVACGAKLRQPGFHFGVPSGCQKVAKLAHERMHPLVLALDLLEGGMRAIALMPLAAQPRARAVAA